MVSICIPTYNGADFLSEAIESAIKQTYTNFELLIIDDCSRDNTLEIANKFAEKDNRIRVFTNPINLGLVGNWNNSISLANGEWIKFLFQDDYLAHDCLEKMMSCSEGQNLVISNRKYIFEEGINKKDHYDYLILENKLNFSNIYKYHLFFTDRQFSFATARYPAINIWGEPTSMLIRKEAFLQYGYFDENFKQTCDLEFWARVGTNSGAAFVHDKLVFFRVHKKSTTMTNHSDKAFYVNFNDFFLFVHKLYYSDLFKKFRSNVSFSKLAIIELELAEHARGLKRWENGKDIFMQKCQARFPEFDKYFLNPTKELIQAQLKSFVSYPSFFFTLMRNKVIGKIDKYVLKKF